MDSRFPIPSARNLARRFTMALILAAAIQSAAGEPPAKVGLPVAALQRETPVDFEKEILPVLRDNCLACHNTTKAKGGLNLETPQLILKGGDTGPGAVAGRGSESLVFKASAHLDPDLVMPPKDNKANALNLAPENLALLKLWIDQGAKGEVRGTTLVNWLEKPPVLNPILALDLTADGQFAACSRGSRVDVYHVPSGRHVARLTDPKLSAMGLADAAHRDLVNAVAFNPDGTRLATAGYRDVKLWRRPPEVRRPLLTNGGARFAVSPDRKLLASPLSDHSIRVVDTATDRVLHLLQGHSNQVCAVAFSADNTRLASIAADGTLRFWNVADGTNLGVVLPASEPRSFAWIGAEAEFAVAGADGIVRVGSVNQLSALRELKAHAGPVVALAALPDARQLLSAGVDGIIRVWDLAEGRVGRQFTQSVATAAMAVSPDGRRLAVAGTNAVTTLWDVESGKRVAELKGDRYAYEEAIREERNLVIAKSDVAFHKKSLEGAEAALKKAEERMAKAAETNNVTEKVYLEKEKAMKAAQEARATAEKTLNDLLAEIQRVTEGYVKAEKAAADAKLRATETSGKATEAQLMAERAATAKVDAERIANDTSAVANRTKAAAATVDAAKETARRIAEESAAVAEKSRAFADAIIADAEMKSKLAADARAAANKAIDDLAALSFAAGQLKPDYDRTIAEAPEKRKQGTNQVQAASKTFADSEKEFKRAETRRSVTNHELELATGSGAKASNVVVQAKAAYAGAEAARKTVEAALERAKQQAAAAEIPSVALAFSPDSRILASMNTVGRIFTWSAETGDAFDVLNRHGAPAPEVSSAGALAFTGGEQLWTASTGTTVVAWILNPAWILERAIGTGDIDSIFADRVNAVRFSPDGQTLAAGGGEPTRSGEIKIFNVADGRLVREMSDVHSDAVLSLDFAPDGRHLASSSADRFAKVIDLTTGKVAKAFEGHTSYVLGVAWKRDSRTLASAGADKVIKVWDFVTGDRRKNIEGAEKDVTGIAFVGVTDQMVAASGDSQVRLIKENGEKVRSFEGATDFVNSAAATPDGKWIVAGGQDGRLHVWSGTDGRKQATFEAPK